MIIAVYKNDAKGTPYKLLRGQDLSSILAASEVNPSKYIFVDISASQYRDIKLLPSLEELDEKLNSAIVVIPHSDLVVTAAIGLWAAGATTDTSQRGS